MTTIVSDPIDPLAHAMRQLDRSMDQLIGKAKLAA